MRRKLLSKRELFVIKQERRINASLSRDLSNEQPSIDKNLKKLYKYLD